MEGQTDRSGNQALTQEARERTLLLGHKKTCSMCQSLQQEKDGC